MDNENERLREYDRRTRELINIFEGRMSASELDGVRDRQYGGECALAVELMLATVVHEKIRLSPEELKLLVDLGRELGADELFMAPVIAMQSSGAK